MTREHAAGLARRGFCVFPCRPGEKRPAVPDWEHRACADPDRVRRFWPGSQHNIGIACGPSNLVVIDLDCHGTLPEEWQMPGVLDGRDVMAQLCDWAGKPWPSTYWAVTPSGGWHLYFTGPEGSEIRNSAGLIGPQVDVRASGGYVVGAGSAVDGKPYEVIDDRPPAPLPGWLARMLTRKPEPADVAPHVRSARCPAPRPGRDGALVAAAATGRARSCGPRTGSGRWPRPGKPTPRRRASCSCRPPWRRASAAASVTPGSRSGMCWEVTGEPGADPG